MDFTLKTYKRLVEAFVYHGHSFQTVSAFIEKPVKQVVLMRHDVDQLPENALRMAELEAELGVKATYYFRITPKSFNSRIMARIAELEHEIGYHYENLSSVTRRKNVRKILIQNLRPDTTPNVQYSDDQSMELIYNLAIEDFKRNLDRFREIVPVRTICMHGSPLSQTDNRDLWKVYDYRDYGIIGEPYLDVDFSDVFYLTDTGRRWDGNRVSIRDRVPLMGKRWPVYRATLDIVAAIEGGTFPDRSMLTVHPQRWTNNPFGWMSELVLQRVKNIGKIVLLRGIQSK